MSDVGLETPTNPDELYLARGDECAELILRPAFTGDLMEVQKRLVVLVQHPCAMRSGPQLAPRQLAAQVAPFSIPSDWSSSHFKHGFLPHVDGANLSARFDLLQILTPDDVAASTRLAVLSPYGVNLLMQRWVYHNTRVAIPTGRFEQALSGPFEEADLIGELSTDLVRFMTAEEAAKLIDVWLNEGHPQRRAQLDDPQHRSAIRRDLARRARQIAANGSPT